MTTNYYELRDLLDEAKPLILNRKALAFRDYAHKTFILILEGEAPPILRLLISVRPGVDRMHLTPRLSPKKNKVSHTAFAASLNAALQDRILTAISIVNKDRTLRLDFKDQNNNKVSLLAEFFNRHANIFLLDQEDLIKEAFREVVGKHRTLKRKGAYTPLPTPHSSKRRRRPRFSTGAATTLKEAPLNGAADDFFFSMEWEQELKELRQKIKSSLSSKLKKEGKLLSRLREQLVKAESAENVKNDADLLQTNFHLLKKGAGTVELDDFYSEGDKKISIVLNPAKSPSENIANYYKRYKKLVSSISHINRRIEESNGKIKQLRSVEEAFPAMESMDELNEAAITLGIERKPAATVKRIKESKASKDDSRKFYSSDSLPILVGKDGASNSRLTFQTARGNDYWLHCQGASGSHVVIRCEKNKTVPMSTLIEAGLLAVHFSKRRGTDYSEVIYTQRKYVRKIRGGPPGKVTVERHKTLNIYAEKKLLDKILNTMES